MAGSRAEVCGGVMVSECLAAACQIAELVDYNSELISELVAQIANLDRCIAERVDRIVVWDNRIAERVDRIVDWDDCIAEQVDRIVDWDDCTAERVDWIVDWDDCSAERVDRIVDWDDCIAERVDRIVDWAAQTVEWVYQIAPLADETVQRWVAGVIPDGVESAIASLHSFQPDLPALYVYFALDSKLGLSHTLTVEWDGLRLLGFAPAIFYPPLAVDPARPTGWTCFAAWRGWN